MSWMAFTWPTGVFFIAIALALCTMTVWELKRPTSLAKGFLPIQTTRGDRFFISLLSAAFIHLIWLGLLGSVLWVASIVSVLWAGVLMRWG